MPTIIQWWSLIRILFYVVVMASESALDESELLGENESEQSSDESEEPVTPGSRKRRSTR